MRVTNKHLALVKAVMHDYEVKSCMLNEYDHWLCNRFYTVAGPDNNELANETVKLFRQVFELGDYSHTGSDTAYAKLFETFDTNEERAEFTWVNNRHPTMINLRKFMLAWFYTQVLEMYREQKVEALKLAEQLGL